VGALLVVPGTGGPSTDILYVGTGEGNNSCDSEWSQGILKSVDGGSNFTQIGVGTFDKLGFTKIVAQMDPVNVNDPSTLFASTTFTDQASASDACVYGIQSASPPGLFESTDHGATRQPLAGLPGGSAYDVAVPQQLIVAGGNSGVNGNPAQTFDGTVLDDGGGGCFGSASMSLDPTHLTDPAHNPNDSKLIVTVDPVSGYDINGKIFMSQGAGICDDYTGEFDCTGTVANLKTGAASFQCNGLYSVINVTGTFGLNDDLTGTFSGSWTMSAPFSSKPRPRR